jgi:hypothetical protein
VTHVLVAPGEAAQALSADAGTIAMPAQVMAPDVSPAQLTELEQRMVSMMRSELNQRVRLASTRATRPDAAGAGSAGGLTLDQIANLIGNSEGRQLDLVTGLNNALVDHRRSANDQLDGLRRQVQELRDIVQQQGGGGGR